MPTRLTWRLSKLENGEEKDKSKVKEDVMNEPNLYTQEPVTLYDEGNVTRIWGGYSRRIGAVLHRKLSYSGP